jgi:asparagine synthase (glutamine-hydrolysing)
MCGLCGFVDYSKSTDESDLKQMIKVLSHRGPDNLSHQIFKNTNYSIGLAHARLSILDLSKKANQPMQFEENVIVFNGEIYNFNEIRQELKSLGHHFDLQSDTEMILHAYNEWGKDCVHKFIGMFSIIIFDKVANKLIFIRDRAGVKPLYYYFQDDLILFGSELKAICEHSKFEKKLNSIALQHYFKLDYIPTPHTIYEGVKKFPSGSIGELNLNSKEFIISKYWDVSEGYSRENENKISYSEAKNKVHDLLKSAINYRKIADVPVGVFLSGGYDSSLVTAVLQNDSKSPIETFTIGFEEGNNEAPYAKEIAKYLGTNHHEYYCTIKDAEAIIKDIPFYYDEPFADSSAIPTMFISKKASDLVKVVISADGGDEVFCGYNTYSQMNTYSEILNKISFLPKKPLAIIFNLISKCFPVLSFRRRKFFGLSQFYNGEKQEQDSLLFEAFKTTSDPILDAMLVNKEKGNAVLKSNKNRFKDTISMCMSIDYKNYLQEDILTKVDRATMSASIEGREPLMDHRLIEYVSRLPIDYKLQGTNKKRILKDIVHDYIPEKMMDRPKAGFSAPVYSWLKGDLSYLLDDYLRDDKIKESGVFKVDFVSKMVLKFKNNQLPDETLIWKLLMFQMWYEKWMKE